MTCGTITIKKWEIFQHYKHRSPPWIRLYRKLLDPKETPWWRGLSDGASKFLMELWLLASESYGTVPYDCMMIAWKLRRPSTDIPRMRGWLEELASVKAIAVAGIDASADASEGAA